MSDKLRFKANTALGWTHGQNGMRARLQSISHVKVKSATQEECLTQWINYRRSWSLEASKA